MILVRVAVGVLGLWVSIFGLALMFQTWAFGLMVVLLGAGLALAAVKGARPRPSSVS